jgi:peptide/nickel transport system permease protein
LPRRLLRFLLAVIGELVLIGAALLAVSMLLSIPKKLEWTYPLGIPVPHTLQAYGNAGFWEGVWQLWEPLLHGSFGTSKGRIVADLVWEPAGMSLLLLLVGFVLAVAMGLLKGMWDFTALRKRKFSLLPGTTALMQGLPDYWLILLCQWGVATLISRGFDVPLLVGYDPAHPVQSLLFPLLIIALVPAGAIAHITGEALVDAVGTDAVRTARAKGLSETLVLWRHALRLALVEVLDALPAVLSMMLTNLVIVESLTYYPGLGRLLVGALRLVNDPRLNIDTDGPIAFAGALILLGTFFLVLEVLRIIRRRVDPRLREEVRG